MLRLLLAARVDADRASLHELPHDLKRLLADLDFGGPFDGRFRSWVDPDQVALTSSRERAFATASRGAPARRANPMATTRVGSFGVAPRPVGT